MPLSLNINEISKLAESKNGKLLSTKYINSRQKYKWQCSQGHIWKATVNSVRGHGTWCPTCGKDRSPSKDEVKKIISELSKIAKSKKGLLLSTDYKNAMQKLKWKCVKGHIFFSSTNAVKHHGYWCLKCSGKEKLSIEILNRSAEAKGGKCLSTKYKNIFTKYKFQCAKGHVWKMSAHQMRTLKQWCYLCSSKAPLKIEDLQILAVKRGGQLLSKRYVNAQQPLKWKCAKGHLWKAPPGALKYRNNWCLICSGSQKLTIKDLIKVAKSRNGKFLSKAYKNINSKYKWECAEGHTWSATANSVKNGGTWCPKCVFFYNEEVCRTTFEQLFNRKFKKAKPEWLRNTQGFKMELDGYCKSLGIAFEYHGSQHFVSSHYYFAKNKENLSRRIDKDREKELICEKKNVKLFIITYKDDLTQLPELIKKRSKKLNVNISNINFDMDIDFNKAYSKTTNLEKYQRLAAKRGGQLLSKKYFGIEFPLKFKCSNDHIWQVKPERIYYGSWCPQCHKKYKPKS